MISSLFIVIKYLIFVFFFTFTEIEDINVSFEVILFSWFKTLERENFPREFNNYEFIYAIFHLHVFFHRYSEGVLCLKKLACLNCNCTFTNVTSIFSQNTVFISDHTYFYKKFIIVYR